MGRSRFRSHCPASAHTGEARRADRGSPEDAGVPREGRGLPEGAGPRRAGLRLVDLRGAVGSSKVVDGPGAPGPRGLLQKEESPEHGRRFDTPIHAAPGQASQTDVAGGGGCGEKGDGSRSLGLRGPPLPGGRWEPLASGWWRVQEAEHEAQPGTAAKAVRPRCCPPTRALATAAHCCLRPVPPGLQGLSPLPHADPFHIQTNPNGGGAGRTEGVTPAGSRLCPALL